MGQPKLKLRRPSAPRRSGKAAWLGYVASLLSRLRIGRRQKATSNDLRRRDFRVSTQRLGIRFNERIRNTFRFRWLKRTR